MANQGSIEKQRQNSELFSYLSSYTVKPQKFKKYDMIQKRNNQNDRIEKCNFVNDKNSILKDF